MQRRDFLLGNGATALALAFPALIRAGSLDRGATSARAAEPIRPELVAEHASEPLVGMPYPPTPVWSFGGSVPGAEIRLRPGERLSRRLVNRLDVATSVHWHGIRVPWAMDGVAGLTQEAVPPGEHFDIDFVPPDAGTYWYHAHANTPEQIGRGLYGPLVVEEETPITVDRELVWMLDDWRLAPDATIDPDFGRRHDASHGGRIGNTITLNGRLRPPIRVRSGERVRLRLINAANARQFALDFGELPVRVVAIDGQPVTPHEPGGPILLPSAGRVDLVVDLLAAPSTTIEVVDRYYREPTVVGALALDANAPLRDTPPDTPIALGTPTLPEPDLTAAIEHEIVIGGGAMGGLREARLGGTVRGMREIAGAGYFWALNDLVGSGYDVPPMLEVARGRTLRLTFRNDTAFVHPMHLHGHHMKLLSVDGQAPARTVWHDSVPIRPDERVEVAFVADNPGLWLLHCHVLEHHMAGMGALVRVA